MDFASISAALNKTFQEPLAETLNRSHPMLDAVQKRGLSTPQIYVKARVASDHGAGPIADGSVVTIAGTEGTTYRGGTLDWATYKANFSINARLLDQVASNPGALGTLFESELMQAAEDLAQSIGRDMTRGVTADGLVGLLAAIGGGSYAGITHANWTTVVVDAAAAQLSTGLLNQADTDFFVRNGYGINERPSFVAFTSPTLYDRFRTMFESVALDTLATGSWVRNTNQSTLGVEGQGMRYMGIPVGRDRFLGEAQATTGDTANTGRIYLLDWSQVYLATLTPTTDPYLQQVQAQQGIAAGIPVAGITPKIEILAKTGEKVEGYVKAYVQLVVPNRARAGVVIKNVANAAA